MGFIYQVYFVGACPLFPVVASLSGGVSFFVSGVFCGFFFGNSVLNCVVNVVIDEWVFAGCEINKIYIV